MPVHRKAGVLAAILCAVVALNAPRLCEGQIVSPDDVRETPPGRPSAVVSLRWENVALRDAVTRLSSTTGDAIFLDRRVDPNRRVRLDVRDATAQSILEQVAREQSLGVTSIGPLYYVGPVEACAALRALVAIRHDEISRLPMRRRGPLDDRAATEWLRMTEPRTLVEQLLHDAGIRLIGSERIPHDLWPAGRLPELTLVARLSVLLAGFDQTFALRDAGRTLEIVPLDQPRTLRASYDIVAQRGLQMADLQRQIPGARLTLADGKLTLEGRWEAHQQLQQLLDELIDGATATPRQPTRRQTQTRQVFTLRVAEQPVGSLIRQLAERLDLDVHWDEQALAAAGVSLERRVSFAVENVDQDGLFDAALRPAGLTYRRDGRRLEIVPAK
jgi:hypothetical protein